TRLRMKRRTRSRPGRSSREAWSVGAVSVTMTVTLGSHDVGARRMIPNRRGAGSAVRAVDVRGTCPVGQSALEELLEVLDELVELLVLEDESFFEDEVVEVVELESDELAPAKLDDDPERLSVR